MKTGSLGLKWLAVAAFCRLVGLLLPGTPGKLHARVYGWPEKEEVLKQEQMMSARKLDS